MAMSLIEHTTRNLFFTGKGGVGKTSLACATAVQLADAGERVLLVSTDPASNLDEVLGQRLAETPTAIPGALGLYALNIDPGEEARRYRERVIEPYRGKLPDSALRSMEEQLSGACTTEIAAFNVFARLLGEPAATAYFDHVIFDTAPTGHTLRLLALPAAWTGFLAANTSGTSCLGPLAGLDQQRDVYAAALATLADGPRTTLILVTRAQAATLREARRASEELAQLGVTNQRVIVNGVFTARRRDDALAVALERREQDALAAHAEWLARMPLTRIPLYAHNLLGVERLRALGRPTREGGPLQTELSGADPLPTGLETLATLVDELAESGSGVVMCMGKGGVGKTTLAAAIACELARRGFPVHLSTTDPAAHVAAVAGDGSLSLRVSRIDPAEETAAYTQHVLNTAGKDLAPEGRALLEEDLRSPCTEEIAVFHAFARTVADGETGFVVLDTAPTGHTLLLLDATEAYHREVLRLASATPEAVLQLLPRLRNPDFTKLLLVTLPEATPVHEAALLQDDLRRAGIEPWAWVVNQSFASYPLHDPLLAARGLNEVTYLREVVERHARRTVLVPWVPEEPVGAKGLRPLVEDAGALADVAVGS